MVTRLGIAATVGAAVALGGALAACAALVDLGPEATLRDGSTDTLDTGLDASTDDVDDVSQPPVDARDATPPPDSPYPCGLPQAPNLACNTCTDQYCCGPSVACSENAACTQASSLLLDCVFDQACVGKIDHDYADSGVNQLQTCVLGHCVSQCFPGPKCLALARCCKDIPADQLASKQTCTGTVNQLDEADCVSILDNVLRPSLGAGFCGGDAGADAAGE
jgi:hypothetical protein